MRWMHGPFLATGVGCSICWRITGNSSLSGESLTLPCEISRERVKRCARSMRSHTFLCPNAYAGHRRGCRQAHQGTQLASCFRLRWPYGVARICRPTDRQERVPRDHIIGYIRSSPSNTLRDLVRMHARQARARTHRWNALLQPGQHTPYAHERQAAH